MTVGRCDPFAWQVRSFCCEMLALSPLSGAFQNHRSNSIRYAKNGSNDNNSMGRQAGLATKAQRHNGDRDIRTQKHPSTQTNQHKAKANRDPATETNKQTNKHTNARHKQSGRQKVGQQTIHHPGLSTCGQINANHPKRDYPSPR